METTTLGATGLRVSRLGAGLAEIGSLDDVEEAGKVLNGALDAGINFLDTAECYGRSEELIGRTVAHRRDDYVLATKAGHVSGGYDGQPWTAATVSDGIDRSLVRMRTDHVDLLQLHAYDIPVPPPDEVLRALLDARQAGKTRFIGYSQENEEADWAVDSGLFDALQTTFNLVDQRARYGLFEKAIARGMGLIMKRPMANAVWGRVHERPGPMTGAPGLFVERARAVASLGPLPGAPEDPIALALGFVLAHPEAHTAIVGTRNPRHMLANIEIVESQLPISRWVVDELHRRFDRIGKYWPSIDTIRT